MARTSKKTKRTCKVCGKQFHYSTIVKHKCGRCSKKIDFTKDCKRCGAKNVLYKENIMGLCRGCDYELDEIERNKDPEKWEMRKRAEQRAMGMLVKTLK